MLLKSYEDVWDLVYEGEGEGEGEGAGEGEGEGEGKSDKVFKQDEVNKILAQERRRSEEKIKTHISELEKLRNAKGLGDKERESLTKRIEEMGNELLTKEQLAAKEKEKIQNEFSTKLKQTEEERGAWEGRYKQTRVLQEITSASANHGAFAANQIIAILQPMTRVIEETDGDGNPTGSFVPKVKFPDVDKDNKPIILDLTVEEAVKRMKDTPDKYGNLFKSTANGGLGLNPSIGKATAADVRKMTPEQYREWRKQNGLAPKDKK